MNSSPSPSDIPLSPDVKFKQLSKSSSPPISASMPSLLRKRHDSSQMQWECKFLRSLILVSRPLSIAKPIEWMNYVKEIILRRDDCY